MIRVLGAVLLIAGAAGCGIKGVVKLRGRARTLSALASSLDIVQSEICDRLTPMPELLELIEREAAYPACVFYGNVRKHLGDLGETAFSEIWRDAIQSTPELLLEAQDALVLAELGMSLGKYNAEEQANALAYAKRRLEAQAAAAAAERDRDSKLHAVVGVAAGVFAVMVLI